MYLYRLELREKLSIGLCSWQTESRPPACECLRSTDLSGVTQIPALGRKHYAAKLVGLQTAI